MALRPQLGSEYTAHTSQALLEGGLSSASSVDGERACPRTHSGGALTEPASESAQSPAPITPHCFPLWGRVKRPQGPWLPDFLLLPAQLGPLPLVLGYC